MDEDRAMLNAALSMSMVCDQLPVDIFKENLRVVEHQLPLQMTSQTLLL
jgi:hypothetical protein